MPDRPNSTEVSSPDCEQPVPVRDAECDRPFREVFARRLPPAVRHDLETAARAAYWAALEEPDHQDGVPSGNDTRDRLQAVIVDLYETVELLRAVANEHRESDMDWPSTMLSILATPRRLEVQAITERIERMLAWKSTPAQLFPPKLVGAVLVPSGYQSKPVE